MEWNQAKLEIYIPPEYVPGLRDALAQAGAGKIGAYDHCLSVTRVTGYWRPLEGAHPFGGTVGKLCGGRECKVEVRCARERIPAAVEAVRRVHPYEKPVVNIVPLLNSFYGC